MANFLQVVDRAKGLGLDLVEQHGGSGAYVLTEPHDPDERPVNSFKFRTLDEVKAFLDGVAYIDKASFYLG